MTVWAVSQSSVVNVNAPLTVAVVVALDDGVMVTFSVGWVANTTVYSSVAPSVTFNVVGSTVTARTATVTATSGAVTLLAP